jgi:hypothetical protein
MKYQKALGDPATKSGGIKIIGAYFIKLTNFFSILTTFVKDKSIISQKINILKLKPTHKIQLLQYLFFYYQFFDYWK